MATPIYILFHTLFLKGDADTLPLKGGVYVPSIWTRRALAAVGEVLLQDVWGWFLECHTALTLPPRCFPLQPGHHIVRNPRPREEAIPGDYKQQPRQGPQLTAINS